jgi:hypothetical protein
MYKFPKFFNLWSNVSVSAVTTVLLYSDEFVSVPFCIVRTSLLATPTVRINYKSGCLIHSQREFLHSCGQSTVKNDGATITI